VKVIMFGGLDLWIKHNWGSDLFLVGGMWFFRGRGV
jgi:hypothetical protein